MDDKANRLYGRAGIVSVLVAFVLAMLMPLLANAEESEWKYLVNEDGKTVTITGWTGTETTVEVV